MLPSVAEIEKIPVARTGEYELSEKETRTLRRRLYSINKDGIRKYRTMREENLVTVWRLR